MLHEDKQLKHITSYHTISFYIPSMVCTSTTSRRYNKSFGHIEKVHPPSTHVVLSVLTMWYCCSEKKSTKNLFGVFCQKQTWDKKILDHIGSKYQIIFIIPEYLMPAMVLPMFYPHKILLRQRIPHASVRRSSKSLRPWPDGRSRKSAMVNDRFWYSLILYIYVMI